MNENELTDLVNIYQQQLKAADILIRQLQADLSDLQRHIPTKQLPTDEVMAKHCTCYKLGYSPLNDYAAVKQK